mmetsp:Transcript_27570/g.85713  ORF Transcript_27570/g.85713 Transcript_27570/m.85713 type:complete len:353 (+) Transcript_27570:86-1144(+)
MPPSAPLPALLVFAQALAAGGARVQARQGAARQLADAEAASDDLANESGVYDYAGLAASAFDFDEEYASQKPWIREILHKFDAVSTEAEDELRERDGPSSDFKTQGPRTFVLTVGGPGAGKSYAMNEIFEGKTQVGQALGPRGDYVIVNADDSREESPAFKEILRVASTEHKALPRNLVQDSHLEFLEQGRKVTGRHWIQIGREYTQGHVVGRMFDRKGRTSVVYDSVCGEVHYCKHLLDSAKRAGFERLAIVSVDVEPECAVYRAGDLRAAKTGRTVPAHYVRKAHAQAKHNVPLLVEEAKRLMPDGWLALTSSPREGSALDEHHCPTATTYAASPRIPHTSGRTWSGWLR